MKTQQIKEKKTIQREKILKKSIQKLFVLMSFSDRSKFIFIRKQGINFLNNKRAFIKKMKIEYRQADNVLCNLELDIEFLESLRQIAERNKAEEQSFLLSEQKIGEEEYEIIHEKARLHANANILNLSTSKESKSIQDENKCGCGCGKGTGEFLPLCTNEQKLSILGSGIILFFFYLRHLRMLMFLLCMIFGIFNEVLNSLWQSNVQEACKQYQSIANLFCRYTENNTFRHKSSDLFFVNIQLWLGTVMCLIWMIGLKLIQSLGMKKDKQIDDSLDSASDYTVKIDNLPYGEYNQHQLIQYLEEIWMEYFASSELQMKSIQIVYNMEEFQQKIQEIFKISEVLISYLEKNQLKFNNKIKNENIEAYKQGKKRMISLFKQLQNARVEFKRNKEIRKKKSTTIAFVEFTTPKKKTQFLECVQETKNPLKDTFMPPKKFLFKGSQPSIARAPEPSDIMWSNCEKCVSYFRVVIIWFFTMIILYISYALISFLQTLDFIKESEGIVTSVILQLVNRLIWVQLSWLVVHELNNTKTEAIISLMKKAMIAQAINIICTPVISKFVNNKGLYGYEGLSTMAITYQLVMVLMMIFYYILNPIYLAKMFCFKVPCLRNILIKKNLIRRYSTAGKTTMEEIKGVLKLYEGPDFPVAGGFVYMTTAIFHSLFFCHLQPFLLMFVAINMSLFFFIMRYMLYRRCTIPEMTNVQVFRFAMFAISCGAAFYGIGCLFFLIIDEDVKIKQNLSLLIPPILCLIIWFVGNLDICGLFTYLNNFLLSALASSTQSKSNKMSKRTFRETINLERLDDHLSVSLNQAHIWSRRECYYRDCNTNKLLQFQNYLRKTKDQFRLKRGQPLKKFCQSFFRLHERQRQDLHKNDDREETEMDLNNFCYFNQHIPVIKDRS